MYYFTTALHTYNIDATDGEMGRIKDLYIDDHNWKIRYAIVDTRKWLPERKVLIPPSAFIEVNEENETLEVEYDKEMIKQSPPVPEESDLTIDKENQLIKYFGWTRYWPEDVLISGEQRAIGVFNQKSERIYQEPEDFEREQLIANHRDNNHKLRSHEEILYARVHGRDGKLGRLEDFVYNTDWDLKYIVIGSPNPAEDEFYYYPVEKVASVDWYEGDLYLDETIVGLYNQKSFHNKREILNEF